MPLKAALLTALCIPLVRCGPSGGPCAPTGLADVNYAITSVSLTGPSVISTDSAPYTAIYVFERRVGFSGPVQPVVTLDDVDTFLGFRLGSRLLSWDRGLTIQDFAGPNGRLGVGFATLDLLCDGNHVAGTANVGPGGSPNDPNSGERDAEVYAQVNEWCSFVLPVSCPNE